MKCALVGSRFFAASVFEALRKEEGIEFTSIVAPAEEDRLAIAARAAGVAVHLLENPRMVPEAAIAEGTDLEWTILEGDPIAGGSVYHLADGWDAAPSRPRTGASSPRARRRANCGSARWRRWACSTLTKMLAERGISIENIHTEIVRSGVTGKQTFKIGAHLLVPATLPVDGLRRELGALASEMMLDINLGERPAADPASPIPA